MKKYKQENQQNFCIVVHCAHVHKHSLTRRLTLHLWTSCCRRRVSIKFGYFMKLKGLSSEEKDQSVTGEETDG